MRQFRRFFALLFVVSTLLGALHEVIHHHHYDMDSHIEESCPLYLLTQTPAVPTEAYQFQTIAFMYESFIPYSTPKITTTHISLKSRSPPLS